jgi:hypothetical protein
MIWFAVVALGLLGVVIYDVTQRSHAILRNFPIVGHFRYLFEAARQVFGYDADLTQKGPQERAAIEAVMTASPAAAAVQ